MIETGFLAELKRIVGAEHVASGRADAEVYRYDGSLATATPDAVVFPADTHETAAVVRLATSAGVPFVPRGFGTNLSGGSIAARGGLIVALTRMNRITKINPEGRYAVVEAGVTNQELQEALAPIRFTYAPDPASQKVSTLGGNVGENSGGPHCVKYGVTSNHVLGMTAVLSGGHVVTIGGAALDPPGYDLRGVMIGSEGTLGFITEVVVRVIPGPESVATLLAIYDSHAAAARSVSAVIAAGIVPATLEMMDNPVINAIEDSRPSGYPRDAAAVLIIEVDGPAIGLAHQADEISKICLAEGCRDVRKAKDAAERDRLWAGRRGAFGAIARLAPSFLVADCTVPRTRLPEALERVAQIAKRYDIGHGNVLHAGDGNLHPVLLLDPRDPEMVERVHRAGDEVMQACVDLGGTITGEHGVGVEKANAMRMIFSEQDLDVQRRLRVAFDPADLMNPGKIFPTSDPENPVSQDVQPTDAEGAWPDEAIPADAEEACRMVRRACSDGTALLPVGNATQLGSKIDWTPACTLLKTARLVSVAEYDPANQVVTVGSGMSLDALQDLLAENGQWLPIRPPQGGTHTLGGLAAAGICGPERLRYGAPRDLILGLKFVSGEGHLITAGGKVVKNVAGYDMARLLVGSFGTLGLITELTYRISSLPQQCRSIAATGSLDQCSTAAAELLRSKLEPNLVVAVPEDASLVIGYNSRWRLAAGFEGFQQVIDFQLDRTGEIFAAAGLDDLKIDDYPAREGFCAEWFTTLSKSPFFVRADLPPDVVPEFLTAAAGVLPEAAVVADFGCGRVFHAAETLAADDWTRLCSTSAELGGHTVVEKATAEFAHDNDVFGPPRADWRLAHKIKAQLDPHQVFAPGRLPGP